jgi:hypothetical protein
VGGGGGTGDRVEVVAHADQFRDVAGKPVEAGHDLRLELHRPGFPGHMGALGVGHVPIRAAVDPGVEVEGPHEISQGHHKLLGEHTLLDHRHVTIYQQPAVEGGDRGLDVERLDQHRHAPRGPAAGDREQDPGLAEPMHCVDSPVGQHLVLRHQRAVDVGQKQPDRVRSHPCSPFWCAGAAAARARPAT